MNKLQSHEINSLNLEMEINEIIVKREDSFYEVFVTTNDAEGDYINVLVTQKNKVRQFKTLDAIDSFLCGLAIYEFTVLSKEQLEERGFDI
jgi:DNA repair exonuclease SbcCD ATPase subunit